MVELRSRRCLHETCTLLPTFNVEGRKTASHCRQHAEEGMVDVHNKRCYFTSCTKRPSFNIDGIKVAMYCKQHADDGMVNVYHRSCSHATCSAYPSYSVVGSKTAVYCRVHAEEGMVDVRSRRCSHISCIRRPAWGVLTESAPTVCTHHKGDIVGGPVINFRVGCKVAGCVKASRWGLDGRQPTYCGFHGPLEDGLACTVGTSRRKRSDHSTSYHPESEPPLRLKTECLF